MKPARRPARSESSPRVADTVWTVWASSSTGQGAEAEDQLQVLGLALGEVAGDRRPGASKVGSLIDGSRLHHAVEDDGELAGRAGGRAVVALAGDLVEQGEVVAVDVERDAPFAVVICVSGRDDRRRPGECSPSVGTGPELVAGLRLVVLVLGAASSLPGRTTVASGRSSSGGVIGPIVEGTRRTRRSARRGPDAVVVVAAVGSTATVVVVVASGAAVVVVVRSWLGRAAANSPSARPGRRARAPSVVVVSAPASVVVVAGRDRHGGGGGRGRRAPSWWCCVAARAAPP